ncbi:hypothetical protein [Actinoalloteichus sp. GBA129-24]|uniref:hypothetical protein n=1 Tax=Actinoalloteichus sp. GBA129-24 TaxID=1612551 RepID=UPI00095037EF|nr:hypothetical protein [Actinoalloteichus sp. GBA129-24]APU22610.1 hypothetical protein UA75_23140 [Actinoalloteichus sp. GBA129-24]
MTTNAEASLREVRDLLMTFKTPACIHRVSELDGAADRVIACAVELLDPEAEQLQRRLASAVRAIQAAEKAAEAHRRNPLTRPISQARFAMQTGSATGAIQIVLEELNPAETAARDQFRNR